MLFFLQLCFAVVLFFYFYNAANIGAMALKNHNPPTNTARQTRSRAVTCAHTNFAAKKILASAGERSRKGEYAEKSEIMRRNSEWKGEERVWIMRAAPFFWGFFLQECCCIHEGTNTSKNEQVRVHEAKIKGSSPAKSNDSVRRDHQDHIIIILSFFCETLTQKIDFFYLSSERETRAVLQSKLPIHYAKR